MDNISKNSISIETISNPQSGKMTLHCRGIYLISLWVSSVFQHRIRFIISQRLWVWSYLVKQCFLCKSGLETAAPAVVFCIKCWNATGLKERGKHLKPAAIRCDLLPAGSHHETNPCEFVDQTYRSLINSSSSHSCTLLSRHTV